MAAVLGIGCGRAGEWDRPLQREATPKALVERGTGREQGREAVPGEETQLRPPLCFVGIGNQKHLVRLALKWMDETSCDPRFWWLPV